MPQVKDGEESKRVLALALSGARAVLLDNVTRIGGPVMDAALTATIWRDRILGVSREVTAPLRPVWIATGNNVELRGDVIRRVNLIRLEAATDTPDARTGFSHDPLIPWIRVRRPELVAACLTVLRAYVVAGRPRVEMRAWGRYESWSDHVRAALVWAGLPDPCCTRQTLEVSDARTPSEEQLFLGLGEMLTENVSGPRMTAKEIVDRLANERGRYHQLRDAIPELIMLKPGESLTAPKLGYLLRGLKSKVRAGKRLCFGEKSGGFRKIYLEDVSAAAPGADGVDRADDSSPRNLKQLGLDLHGRETWAPSAPSAPDSSADSAHGADSYSPRNSGEGFQHPDGAKSSARSTPSALLASREEWRRTIQDCPHAGVSVTFPDGETVVSSNAKEGD